MAAFYGFCSFQTITSRANVVCVVRNFSLISIDLCLCIMQSPTKLSIPWSKSRGRAGAYKYSDLYISDFIVYYKIWGIIHY